ncbi:fumarylacetoacetate hydrolase family protein [Pusillimonas noertemannii]|uniref:2-keto-4-pentenoate hydratase/2-oxohepta-3-ene-1,7-dioic acid hydratase in catechol pathway n=1 Tax=Pusillimonas noertemannii TaxID=305977 RepID=A0A2U1CPU6_9BURK|nr:fumarylacetoacetate hydrolase family protein [Pusillimonas noertemannii]NYT67235.1 fumarylacetoacetate hydrolase family protein [Pusillimonas noertemannii]PVY67908.1 2-keto-4-pentenoate hydratase/2-oxohepta-3-ene-1,7-dioic acid hydratase in catechol pathway [Pusillimonas noertemannii]
MTYKLLSYHAENGIVAGILVGDRIFPVAQALNDPAMRSTMDVLEQWREARPKLAAFAKTGPAGGLPLAEARLAAPIPRPPVIYCVGANYKDHVENMARATGVKLDTNPQASGQKPWFFIKSPASVVGTGEKIRLDSTKLDWEAELALVVGVRSRGLTQDNALECIAAVANANDLSARDYMLREKQDISSPFRYDWIGHKSFDGSCPMGPWLMPMDDVSDVQDLPIRLWVNNTLRQNSSTGNMIFTAAEQIAYLSNRLTLHPGDVILTGTPAGPGAETGEFLKSGDVVRVQIGDLGELVNTIS